MKEAFGGLLIICLMIMAIVGLVWLGWSSNPETPAGSCGYVTQGAVFGSTQFLGIQYGPTSLGRTWRAEVVNVPIVPRTFSEEFNGGTSVLAKDSVKVGFTVHVILQIKPEKEQVQRYVEHYTAGAVNGTDVLAVGYANFLREPLRTFARNEVQQFNALEIKDHITDIGAKVESEVRKKCEKTPFDILQVVVGNIQYPDSVANAVAEKMAASQRLEQTNFDAQRRIKEAEGIAKAMDIVQVKLTPLYLQHEAVEAQKAMVGSPNHTVIYIPTGEMGVPVIGTTDVEQKKKKS